MSSIGILSSHIRHHHWGISATGRNDNSSLQPPASRHPTRHYIHNHADDTSSLVLTPNLHSDLLKSPYPVHSCYHWLRIRFLATLAISATIIKNPHSWWPQPGSEVRHLPYSSDRSFQMAVVCPWLPSWLRVQRPRVSTGVALQATLDNCRGKERLAVETHLSPAGNNYPGAARTASRRFLAVQPLTVADQPEREWGFRNSNAFSSRIGNHFVAFPSAP